MASIYEEFTQGRQNGEARRTKRTLSQHLQGALGGDQAALSQVYAADPDAGMQVQKLARQNMQDDMGDVAKAADFYRKTGDPKAYAYLHQRLSTNPQFAGLPATIDTPEDQEGAVKFAQAIVQTYGKAGPAELAPRVIGDSLVDATGKPIYTAPEKQDYQWSERAGAWIPKPMAGGMPQAPPQGQPMGQMSPMEQMPEGEQITPFAPDVNIPQSSAEYAAFQAASEDANSPNPTGQPFTVGQVPYTPFQAPPGANTFGNGQPRAPQRQPQGLSAIPVAGIGPKPEDQSDIERRIQLARSLGASDGEILQMVVGRDGAAAGAKPMPVAAINMIKEETNAANSAQSITTSIEKHLGRMQRGELDFGPAANLINKARNATGQSTAQSRNYQEFASDLEKLRNDSLRLNSGVQTDGDAQRAWNELFANLNDAEYVRQRLQTINELNKRAEGLRRMNIEMIRENYGKGESTQQAPASAPRRLKFNPATGRLE